MGRNRIFLILIIVAFSFFAVYFLANGLLVSSGTENPAKPRIICIRVDDVQDFGFHDAQMRIIQIGEEHEIPLSYSVISKDFSADSQLILSISEAMRGGSEVTAHGWSHQEFVNLSYDDQVQELLQAKKDIRDVLGVEVSVLVPPLFTYNNDTLRAMNETGYDVLSSDILHQSPGAEFQLSNFF